MGELLDLGELQAMLDSLPEATTNPCGDCPWRRCSLPGWLGPFTAREWLEVAHSDAPIACHETLHGDAEWDSPGVKQCRGSAIFRANVLKSPRHPLVAEGPVDEERVFGSNAEFLLHHEPHEARFQAKGGR